MRTKRRVAHRRSVRLTPSVTGWWLMIGERQPLTRWPLGCGPARFTVVMYTGRDSVDAWMTRPLPIYIATWWTGE